MQRKRKILIVAHCILNQNTVIDGEARAFGAIPSALQWVEKEGMGVLQLPCPEFTYLGLDRPPMTYEQYDNEGYRAHCRKLLVPVLDQLLEYKRKGYEITGALSIQSSPSCDPTRGVYMEELQNLFQEKQIPLEREWYLPNDENPIFNETKHFLENK